ncbi:TonB family protein [Phreatobacter sp.]|uniref:energy transducer TonB n=1 Tax=Phreatobacter sp. TaxID=1966341 RepID=UPI003F7296DD
MPAPPAPRRTGLQDRPGPAGPGEGTATAAILPLVLRAERHVVVDDASAPPVTLAPVPASGAIAAPAVLAPDGVCEAAHTAPAVTPDRPGCPYATAGGRLTAFILASIILHTTVAAFAIWIAWMKPPAATSGEDAVPVELVVAAEEGAAARQERASGTEDTTADAVPSEARQAVEAPQTTEMPQPAAEPVEAAPEGPPVDQPDPETTAERILDQLPVPPMPDQVPVIETAQPPVRVPDPQPDPQAVAAAIPVPDLPAETELPAALQPPPPTPQPDERAVAAAVPVPDLPAETQVSAALQPPPPAPQPDPRDVAAAVPVPDLPVETPLPAELQATLPQPRPDAEQPAPPRLSAVAQPNARPTPPAVQPPRATPPVAQATRPASRREAPTTTRRTRPTQRAAATPQPERRAQASRQTAAQARTAPRGEGTGQRNSQESRGTANSGAAAAAAMAGYRARVLAHLARFKIYPDQARERGVTGRAVIAFTLSASGQVTASSLAGSSGAAVLDQATMAMLRRAQPFPPMPPGSPGTMRFTAGIRYNLH